MNIRTIKSVAPFAAIVLACAAFTARAENTESGGGPIDFGGRAEIFVGPANAPTDGGSLPPLAQQNLGAPAVVSVAAPNPIYNDGATGDIRVAHRAAETMVAGADRGATGTR